ncbi:MAG: hypothetical protein HWD58_04260 [Bacteroidota bacterium]|nr:MAG: hypothetical protein HWD58_04260 [Bacteroidota bacterium]
MNYNVVTKIEEHDEFVRVLYSDNHLRNSKEEEYRCDYVIFAGGFGTDKANKATYDSISYWENDNRDDNNRRDLKDYLIYGNGDGGIIDALRLCFHNFRFQNIYEFASENIVLKIGHMLEEIQEELRQRSDLDEEKQANYFYEKMLKVIKPEYYNEVIQLFKVRFLKSDIRNVSLLGKTTSPFNIKTSLLNRVLIFFSIASGYVSYYSSENELKNKLVPPRESYSRWYLIKWFQHQAYLNKLEGCLNSFDKINKKGLYQN